MTVPETPFPDQRISEIDATKKKEYGISSGPIRDELVLRKRRMPLVSNSRAGQNKEPKHSNSNVFSRTKTLYKPIVKFFL